MLTCKIHFLNPSTSVINYAKDGINLQNAVLLHYTSWSSLFSLNEISEDHNAGEITSTDRHANVKIVIQLQVSHVILRILTCLLVQHN